MSKSRGRPINRAAVQSVADGKLGEEPNHVLAKVSLRYGVNGQSMSSILRTCFGEGHSQMSINRWLKGGEIGSWRTGNQIVAFCSVMERLENEGYIVSVEKREEGASELTSETIIEAIKKLRKPSDASKNS